MFQAHNAPVFANMANGSTGPQGACRCRESLMSIETDPCHIIKSNIDERQIASSRS